MFRIKSSVIKILFIFLKRRIVRLIQNIEDNPFFKVHLNWRRLDSGLLWTTKKLGSNGRFSNGYNSSAYCVKYRNWNNFWEIVKKNFVEIFEKSWRNFKQNFRKILIVFGEIFKKFLVKNY